MFLKIGLKLCELLVSIYFTIFAFLIIYYKQSINLERVVYVLLKTYWQNECAALF